MKLRLVVPFDLDVTLCCGQVFRWEKRAGWWFGVIGDCAVKVNQSGDLLEFEGVAQNVLSRYFGFDHDLDCVARVVGRDEYMRAALREFWGLRLVRQEPWECLASFICATYKSVAAIQQMLRKLSIRFGEPVEFEGEESHVFPSAAALAGASVAELEACGLGYRAKYLSQTALRVVDGSYDVDTLRKMTYVEAKRVMLEFPGVGRKVADCVLLFGLGKFEAFPVDVWMKRVLLRHYAPQFDVGLVGKLEKGGMSNGDYEKLNGFGRNYFGCYAGYAQEYLYHYERCRVHDHKVEKPMRAIP